MTDIVERLRNAGEDFCKDGPVWPGDDMLEAADEIESLRQQLALCQEAEKLPVKYYKEGGVIHAVYGSSSIDYVESLRQRVKELEEQRDAMTECAKNHDAARTKYLLQLTAERQQLAEVVDECGEYACENNGLKQQLAECQARNVVLRDLLKQTWAFADPASLREAARDALAMPSDATALDTMKKQWQLEALLEFADLLDAKRIRWVYPLEIRQRAKELE